MCSRPASLSIKPTPTRGSGSEFYRLENEKHDPSNLGGALQAALKEDGRLPIGVFYESSRPAFEEEDITLKQGTLVKSRLGLTDQEWSAAVEEFL